MNLLRGKEVIVFGTSIYISSNSRTFSLFLPPFTHRYTVLSQTKIDLRVYFGFFYFKKTELCEFIS